MAGTDTSFKGYEVLPFNGKLVAALDRRPPPNLDKLRWPKVPATERPPDFLTLPGPSNTTIEGLPGFIRVSMDGGCLSARDRGHVFLNRDCLTVGNRPPDGFSLTLSGGGLGFSYFLRG